MKTKNKKEAKFFCESCGSEVPRNAKVCPVCGKFFASVRCPKCGKIGSVDDFKNGCPFCGYAVNPFLPQNLSKNTKDNQKKSSLKNKNTKLKNKTYFSVSNSNSTQKNDSGLPIWIYFATILVLIILVAILYSCLK